MMKESQSEIVVAMKRQLMNPFTGSYDCSVRIHSHSKGHISGGLYTVDDALTSGRVNMYRVTVKVLFVYAELERLHIDLKTGAVMSLDFSAEPQRQFVGTFDEDAAGTWRFISASDAPNRRCHDCSGDRTRYAVHRTPDTSPFR